jgi:hypothetical protein
VSRRGRGVNLKMNGIEIKREKSLKVGSEKKVNEDNCTVHVQDVLLSIGQKRIFYTKDIMRFGAFNFEKHVFPNFTF